MASKKEYGQGYFTFGDSVSATAHACLDKAIFFELFNNFSCTASVMRLSVCAETSFIIGECPVLSTDGYEYAINVTESGVSINAETERGLIHGFLSLLELIEPRELEIDREELAIPVGRIWDHPDLEYRMAHLCFFPEQTPAEIEKYVLLWQC